MKLPFKKPHVHIPTDPVAINLMRANSNPGDVLSWRCECGKMINDKTREEVTS